MNLSGPATLITAIYRACNRIAGVVVQLMWTNAVRRQILECDGYADRCACRKITNICSNGHNVPRGTGAKRQCDILNCNKSVVADSEVRIRDRISELTEIDIRWFHGYDRSGHVS